MRHAIRRRPLGEESNVVTMRPRGSDQHRSDELTAFRGFVIAAGASVVFWGLCLTVLWLVRWRG